MDGSSSPLLDVNSTRPKAAKFRHRPTERPIHQSDLDRSGFFQRRVSAVFVDRFQTACSDADADKLLQLRHPNAMCMQIWPEDARNILRDVTSDTAFFLGHTAAMNNAAASGA